MFFKRVTAVILAVSLMAMAGCGGAKKPAGDGETLDPVQMADDMFAVFRPQGELAVVEDSVLDNYYKVDSDVIDGHKIYISTSFIAEEIAVFSVKDGKTEDAKKMLEQRLADLKASFDGYLPEELASLEANAKILTNGNLICLMTGEGDGFAEAEKIFISL